jgi:hypothetical protein
MLPKVMIDNPRKVPLTDVLVEDRKVWEAERGAVFAAEVGPRRFIFKARGRKNGVLLVNIVKGEKVQHVTVPDMEEGSDEPPKPETPGDAPKSDPSPPPAAGAEPSDGSMQRTIGWVSIGVGGVAAIVGSIEGISTLNNACSGGKSCTADEKSSGNTSATISDIAFVVAGLGVVGGIALIATAPSSSSSSAAPASGSSPSRHAGAVTVTPKLGLGWASLSGTF